MRTTPGQLKKIPKEQLGECWSQIFTVEFLWMPYKFQFMILLAPTVLCFYSVSFFLCVELPNSLGHLPWWSTVGHTISVVLLVEVVGFTSPVPEVQPPSFERSWQPNINATAKRGGVHSIWRVDKRWPFGPLVHQTRMPKWFLAWPLFLPKIAIFKYPDSENSILALLASGILNHFHDRRRTGQPFLDLFGLGMCLAL